MRKQEREELSVLLQIPGYVFWKDSKGRFTGCNNAFAEFLGIAPEEIVGKNDEELSAWLGVSCGFNWAEGKPTQNKVIDGQGQVHKVVTSKKPLHNDKGQIVGTIGLFIDV